MKLVKHFMNKTEEVSRNAVKMMVDAYEGEPDIILDIGANVGMYTLYFAEAYPNAEIHSFEPVNGTFEILKANVEMNDLQNNTRLWNYGIYSEKGMFELGIPKDRESGNIGLYSMKIGKAGKDVAIGNFVTLESFGIGQADIIKMDVEGCELDIINANKEYFSNAKMLHLELNKKFKANDEIKRVITELGFKYKLNTRRSDEVWVK